MSHFILDILASPSYPFAGEAPPGLSATVRDVHVMWWTAGSCIQVTATDERVFLVFRCTRDAQTAILYSSIDTPRQDTAPLVDANGVVWGWVLPGDSPGTAFNVSGNYALSPSVFMPSASPLEAEPTAVEVTAEGSIVAELDPETNTVTFRVLEDLFERPAEYVPEEATGGDKDSGIVYLGGAAGAITLDVEGAVVTLDTVEVEGQPSILNSILITPDEEVWGGCYDANPVYDALICSQADGSTVPYPLDATACGSPPCAPDWEWE